MEPNIAGSFFLVIVLSIFLSLVHYFSERIHIKIFKKKIELLSFTSGISVTYIFMWLFPELFIGFNLLRNWLFAFLLAGFTAVHLIEKYLYQHEAGSKLRWELKEIHSISFFVYHFIIGIILINFFKLGALNGFLFFIPILFHSAISPASLNELHGKIKEKKAVRVFLSMSTFFGVLFTTYIKLSPAIYNAFLGFVVGALLYIVTRDALPKGKRGAPLHFLSGVVIYALLIILVGKI